MCRSKGSTQQVHAQLMGNERVDTGAAYHGSGYGNLTRAAAAMARGSGHRHRAPTATPAIEKRPRSLPVPPHVGAPAAMVRERESAVVLTVVSCLSIVWETLLRVVSHIIWLYILRETAWSQSREVGVSDAHRHAHTALPASAPWERLTPVLRARQAS